MQKVNAQLLNTVPTSSAEDTHLNPENIKAKEGKSRVFAQNIWPIEVHNSRKQQNKNYNKEFQCMKILELDHGENILLSTHKNSEDEDSQVLKFFIVLFYSLYRQLMHSYSIANAAIKKCPELSQLKVLKPS